MGGGYLPHIINCSLIVLHCTVPETALDTKQTALGADTSLHLWIYTAPGSCQFGNHRPVRGCHTIYSTRLLKLL
jgi:hypothetical protein